MDSIYYSELELCGVKVVLKEPFLGWQSNLGGVTVLCD
jgi:hypothetical protein